MRILMLAQFYSPIVGGEEHMVQNLSRELAARGHEVTIATLRLEGTPAFEDDRGVRVYRINSLAQHARRLYQDGERPHVPPLPDPGIVRGLRRVIERERPQIVHAHNWMLHSFLPLKKSSGLPLVVSLHDYSLACANKRLMQNGRHCSGPGFRKCLACAGRHYGALKGFPTALSNWAMAGIERSLVDLFLPVSQATAQGNGLVDQQAPYEVIPNFIPDDIASQGDETDPRLLQLPEGDFLLFAGDLSHDKGIEVLLQAYAGLENAPPLVLIGRKFDSIPTHLPPNVLALGRWPHASVMAAWRRSQLGLVPSIWPEPFGLVAIEAMASGVPVIGSRIGGLVDIIEECETGLLVPPGDVDALRAAIRHLLADPTTRRQMGRTAEQRVCRFFASQVVPRVEEVYSSFIY